MKKISTRLQLKKLLIVFICFFSLAGVCACRANYINNTETGEIILPEQKISYADGSYRVYEKYLNDRGYSGVMSALVSGGKLVGINFDYVTPYSERYSYIQTEEEFEAVESFKSEVKSLNNRILQAQSLNEANISVRTETERSYVNLAKTLFEIIETGEVSYCAVSTSVTLSAYGEYRENGYRSVLKVTFSGENIVSIDFSQRNETNANITANHAYMEEFNALAVDDNISYTEIIKRIDEISPENTLYKEGLPEFCIYLQNDYNSLAAAVLARHVYFDNAIWLL